MSAVEWPNGRAAEMLASYIEFVKMTGQYAERHYIPDVEEVIAALRADERDTRAYAEGRKDEREEWEALRAQLVGALQRAERCIAGYTTSAQRECDLPAIRAAIATATGGQQP